MMGRQEEALQVAKEIHELEAKLTKLRERFTQLVPNGPPPQGGEGTFTDQILAFMHARPGQVMKVSQIVQALPDIDARLLRNLVFRLGTEKRLKKHEDRGRGHYSYEPGDGGAGS